MAIFVTSSAVVSSLEVKTHMGLSLILFDTSHITEYVFGTNRLKEIRGASSLLDGLNRKTMKAEGEKHGAKMIYTNAGVGLFAVDSGKAKGFEQDVTRAYSEATGGAAAIISAVQELSPDAPQDFEMLLEDYSIRDELKLLHYRLLEAKGNPVDRLMLPSHSFMRPCNACGVNYASEEKTYEGEDEKFYCNGCLEKRKEEREGIDAHLWRRIIKSLRDVKYVFPDNSAVERDSGIKIDPRPNDFNEFSLFSKGKDYMGLIYADGNNMGMRFEKDTLREVGAAASCVDDVIHEAMALAIKEHLPIVIFSAMAKRSKFIPLISCFWVGMM